MIGEAATSDARLNRLQGAALLAGVVGLGLCAFGAFLDSAQFYRSYLLAYLFWVSFALGSLGITMLHNMVGGKWGVVIKRFLDSGMRTLPLMALLVIPILMGIPALYHWSHADVVKADEVLRHKEGYLNTQAFIARTAIYFLIWIGMAILLWRRSGTELEPRTQHQLKLISAPGLIVFAFTVTFAGVDWIMSLESHWFSTIYGAILLVGQALQTFALCVILLALLADRKPFAGLLQPSHFHDLGNLLLAFTVLWTYTSFSQFLIIWSGNIPEETPWYIRRTAGGWQFVAVVLTVFHFLVPFFVLLSRYVKRRGALLARLAGAIIFMRLVDLFFWIEPAFNERGFGLHWMHLAAPIGLGGIWIAFFIWNLKRGPLLNVHDPRIQPEGVHH